MLNKFRVCFSIAVFSFFSALNYNIFVFPNSFAPAGIDGICTMIQDVSQINIGYLSLLANIPLLIVAFIKLNRHFVIKTTIYVVCFSLSSILLKYIGVAEFAYKTDTGTSIVLAPIFAGAIRGILYAITLKINASSGGVDIIAKLVKKKNPTLNLMNIIFAFNLLVALSSFFVYGYKIESVICSIIYAFISSYISNSIQSSESETIRFEVITSNTEALREDILSNAEFSTTIIPATGGYSGEEKNIVICVMQKSQVHNFQTILKKYDDVVVFKSVVNNSLVDI